MTSIRTVQSLGEKILRRIRGRGRGAVVVPGDFVDLGSRGAVDLTLHRLVRRGTLQRLARGLYHFPKTHPMLGELAPSTEMIAKALAGKHQIRLQPSPAFAANALRLTDQVPARTVFLTDGPSRKLTIGGREIVLKHATPRQMSTAERRSGLVIQALLHLGEGQILPEHVARLHQTLGDQERRQLLGDLRTAPIWMHSYLRSIAAEEPRP